MDSAIALPGLEGVNLADIALKLAFLTAPGVAVERWLRRFRAPSTAAPAFGDRPAGGRMQRLTSQFASFATLVAMLVAGLGLVPLARALYDLLSRVNNDTTKSAAGNQWALALVGVALLAVLARYGWQVVKGLVDGKVDRWPWVWLVPVPLLAMVIWTWPVVTSQVTSQTRQSVQMLLGRHPADDQSGPAKGGESEKPPKHPSHGSKDH